MVSTHAKIHHAPRKDRFVHTLHEVPSKRLGEFREGNHQRSRICLHIPISSNIMQVDTEPLMIYPNFGVANRKAPHRQEGDGRSGSISVLQKWARLAIVPTETPSRTFHATELSANKERSELYVPVHTQLSIAPARVDCKEGLPISNQCRPMFGARHNRRRS